MGTEQLNIRIPADLAAEFGRQVKTAGETKSAVVVELLRQWVEERRRAGAAQGDALPLGWNEEDGDVWSGNE